MGRGGMFRAGPRPMPAERATDGAPPPPRPEGGLVWWRATTPAHADIALRFAQKLAKARPDLHLVLSGPTDLPDATRADRLIVRYLDEDDAGAVQGFLDHWRPDIGIWTQGDLKPALIGAAHRSGVTLCLVDADEAHLSGLGWRILPSATRGALRRFALIMARSAATESHLRRRLGLRDAEISVTGPLRSGSRPLPCNISDHEELSGLLRARPVWLAARLHPEETDAVLEANRRLVRVSHRVLLVIAPALPDASGPFHDALRAGDWRYVTWSEGGLPDESTQVILADTAGELGLWYRIAPISFMGGSLVTGMQGSDPNEPAVHGSAILYGPHVQAWLSEYARYAGAGAARIVRDAVTLAEAVRRIIPPDQSAAMAHAAWDVATQDETVMDRLLDVVLGTLDARRTG